MRHSSFKGFGTSHSYARRKINRVGRFLQKGESESSGNSRPTQGGNGSNAESRTGNPDLQGETGDRSVSLHLQSQRELHNVKDPARHQAEWVQGSAIDPDLTALNLVSIEGNEAFERLFYSDGIKRLNTGRLPTWILKKYAHLDQGGWWANGVAPTTGALDDWGCFKPNQPRVDATKGKYQKYEHPYKAPATMFALRVPQAIWEKIAERYGVDILPTDIDWTRADQGFWRWVINNPKISITITEGVKKAAALLSLGFAAIGLPGIWGGYRKSKNDSKPSLLPQLEVFASGDRQFYFAFDQDEKRETRQTNRKALWHTARLLQGKGCDASIVQWEPWIKGVDDLIIAKGAKHFSACYLKALLFDDWIADGLRELNYKPALRLDKDSKYLGTFAPPPNAKLICLKSPKGSGKTEWLVQICTDAQSRGQKVLILTHRTQLGKALCDRFGIDYVDELGESTTKGVFGIGLCFDSLRQNSKARFDPEDWHGCIVILDECEQSIWHLLNAKTEVARHRVPILRNFRQLIQNALGSDDGRVYMSDADLSDLSIDYIRSLVGFPVEPWIALKEGNPEPWDVTAWESSEEMLGVLESRIRRGEKPLIFVDGQKAKSKWGTQNMEAYLLKEFPGLRILRIDAVSVSTPGHAAYDCIDKLDNTLKDFDACVASPTIETGVSIDLRGHFTSVWDFAQGVIPVSSVLQRMARLREAVPRHVWARNYGLGRIGNGATSPKRLMSGQETKFNAHVKQLVESDFICDFESASSFQPQALRTWAKMAARINLGMIRYQHEIIRALVSEGHNISTGDYLAEMAEDDQFKIKEQVKEELTEIRDKSYQHERDATTQAPTPDGDRLKTLQQKKAKSIPERLEQRKGELSERYGESLVSPELVELDDKGEFQKAQLHYYLTDGQEFLGDREKTRMERLLESGENELFITDVNRRMIGGKLAYLKALGIPELLRQDAVEWTNESQPLIDLAIKTEQFLASIKDVLGISFNFNRIGKDGEPLRPSPVAIGQKYLRDCLGLKFSTPIKRGAKGNQQRCYQPVEIPELRQKMLSVWRECDEQQRAAKLAEVVAKPAESSPTVQCDNGGFGDVTVEQNSVTVGSTGNIYIPVNTAYQNAAYQSAAYQDGVREEAADTSVCRANSEAPVQRDSGGFVSSSDTVSTTGNIYIPVDAAYQNAAYQNAAYQDEVPTGELSVTERLIESFKYCHKAIDLTLIIEGFQATSEQVEDAIALQDSQPRRQQLSAWYVADGTASETQREKKPIIEVTEDTWRETIKTYGQLLSDGFEYGIEVFRDLIKPWSQEERWGAIQEFERNAPEKMDRLVAIAPDWIDWCLPNA